MSAEVDAAHLEQVEVVEAVVGDDAIHGSPPPGRRTGRRAS